MLTEETSVAAAALSPFRATFYLLLARGFSQELDRDALKSMEKVSRALVEASDLLELPAQTDFKAGRELLASFFDQSRQEDDERVVEDLARCFASLFLGVGPKTVSPCESVYRSDAPLLCQSTHFEVKQAYQEIGMAKNTRFREPDDHIAVELSYMATLCELTQEAAGEDRELPVRYLKLQRDFLDTHLLPWVDAFSRELLEATGSPFYQAMAHLLKGYLQVDNQLIASMMHGLDPTTKPH